MFPKLATVKISLLSKYGEVLGLETEQPIRFLSVETSTKIRLSDIFTPSRHANEMTSSKSRAAEKERAGNRQTTETGQTEVARIKRDDPTKSPLFLAGPLLSSREEIVSVRGPQMSTTPWWLRWLFCEMASTESHTEGGGDSTQKT